MTRTNSITFNGVRLDSLGVGWKTTNRPTSPEKKTFEFSPSARDGSYDFSTFNPDNRPHYEPIQISGEIMIVREKSIEDTQLKLQRVMRFLHSAQGKPANLIFDDSPNRVYLATFLDSTAITAYELRKYVVITVTFMADPFPHSGVQVKLFSIKNTSGTYTFQTGSWYTRPIITVTGTFSKITLKSQETGRQLVYSGVSVAGNETVIDFNSESVVKDGKFFNEYMEGDYWEFSPYSADGNKMKITVEGDASFTVKFNKYEVY